MIVIFDIHALSIISFMFVVSLKKVKVVEDIGQYR